MNIMNTKTFCAVVAVVFSAVLMLSAQASKNEEVLVSTTDSCLQKSNDIDLSGGVCSELDFENDDLEIRSEDIDALVKDRSFKDKLAEYGLTVKMLFRSMKNIRREDVKQTGLSLLEYAQNNKRVYGSAALLAVAFYLTTKRKTSVLLMPLVPFVLLLHPELKNLDAKKA